MANTRGKLPAWHSFVNPFLDVHPARVYPALAPVQSTNALCEHGFSPWLLVGA